MTDAWSDSVRASPVLEKASMRIPMICYGDRTTTGGRVLVASSTIDDDGRKVALLGDQATCGRCSRGPWPILGTGQRVNGAPRPVAVQGDLVQCPCGMNRLVASIGAGLFANAVATAPPLPQISRAPRAESRSADGVVAARAIGRERTVAPRTYRSIESIIADFRH